MNVFLFNFFIIQFFCIFLTSASEIKKIDFDALVDPNEISVSVTGSVSFVKKENVDKNQVILEFSDTSIARNKIKKIDTSVFDKSQVSSINVERIKGKPPGVRITIQEKQFIAPDVIQDENGVRVRIPGITGDSKTEPVPVPTPTETAAPENLPPLRDRSNQLLGQFIEHEKSSNFTGKSISLQLREVELSDVFRFIGEVSGFNVILGDDVQGKITLSLVDVPWDQALDVVLKTGHLGAERNNNILRIATLTGLAKEKTDELSAKRAIEANTPQITKIFAINYANIADLQQILIKFASGSPNGSSGAVSTAIVQLDNRTNSIVIRDYPENIEKMKKLIEILDTQTPEVMIEAKIVEAKESFSSAINGGLGLGGVGNSSFYVGLNGGDPLDTMLGSGVTGVNIATNSQNGAVLGFSPNISFIPGLQALNAVLTLQELESRAKIVTAPKTVVLNKQKATIVEGQPVLVPVPVTVVPGGTTTTGNSVAQSNISLDVTPTVTNDGSVLLELSVEKDTPVPLSGGQEGIGKRTLSTHVLVESGTTLVIGGIYSFEVDTAHSGVPILKDIPIIGVLFSSSSESIERTELFIFITPKIINLKSVGSLL